MRTALDRLHVPDHPSSWWVAHSLFAVAAAAVLLYAAAVLVVVSGRMLL